MKLIIDIPENYYKDLMSLKLKDSEHLSYEMEMIKNGTSIPDNATNGDIEQMMFPDAEVDGETDLIVSFSIDSYTPFTKKWWNAPYQKGCKE